VIQNGDFGPSSRSAGTTRESLLERLVVRDVEAWQQLTDLYGPLVYYWCRRHSLTSEDAADVFQEVFSAVSASIGGFRRGRQGGGTFRGWLWTITRNKIRDHYRRKSMREAAAGGTEAQRRLAEIPEELTDDSTDQAERSQVDSLFHRGLELVRAEFEQRTWEAFWRVAIDGHRAADMAEELGISANGVRQAKSRVLRRLRERLGDLLD